MSKSVRGRSFPPPHDDSPPTSNHHPNEEQRCRWNRRPKRSNSDRCDYGAEIENIDKLFGLILNELQLLGEYNNTIVCISSDHGEMLGDHGDIGKSVPWEASTSVPLVCMGPDSFGIVRGKVINTPVSTMDLASTFLDFAGVSPHPGMTSVSLRKFLTDTDAVPNASTYRSTVSSGLQDSFDANFRSEMPEVTGTNGRETMEKSSASYSWRMLVEVETGLKFICCKGQCPGAPSTVPTPNAEYMELLYNVTADPFDMHPLSGTDEYADAMDRLRVQLPITPYFHCSKRNASAHEKMA
jgi:arylsulfatase A-like enzyme